MNNNKIYRYPSHLQIKFPEGLENIEFLKEIDGFNYLSIRRKKGCKIVLPNEFEKTKLPQSFLEEIRKRYYDEIEQLRKKSQFQNIIYNDTELSASQIARNNMMAIISIADSAKATHYWKDVTEKKYKYTINDFKQILQIISTRDSNLYYIEAKIREEIDLKLSPSSLQSVELDGLWKKYETSINKNK